VQRLSNYIAALAIAAASVAAQSTLAAPRSADTYAESNVRRHLTIENDVAPAAVVAAAATASTAATPTASHGFADTLRGMADGLLGIRYRFGGNTEEGLDCSGLVRLVWQRLGLGHLPRTAASMAAAGLPIAKSELAPGDLVFFNTLGRSFSHVGVYLGEGRFLHASSSKRRVMLNSLNERYFVERFDGARRVVH
jgi:cell wall-associated NlpC family hydrolase